MVWDFDRCSAVFTREIALIKTISAVEDSVCQAVMAREWADFDWKMAEINQLGQEFTRLEAERVEILDALRENVLLSGAESPASQLSSVTQPSFYELVSKLPQDECRALYGLYRELKMETLKMKAQNETFVAYLNEIKTITSAWLEAVFPAQGGKLYTRKGRQASGDMRSMVFNRSI